MSAKEIRKKWFYEKNRQRKIMRQLQRKHHIPRKKTFIHSVDFPSGDRILNFLRHKKFIKSNYFSKFTGLRKRLNNDQCSNSYVLKIPAVFSFIKNPEESISILRQLVKYGASLKTKKIYIDHSECKDLGICASTIMDTLILSIKEKHRNHSEFRLEGKTSNTPIVNEILAASGLIHHLHIYDGDVKGVERLELLHNEPSNDMSQKIIEYLVRCLNYQGFKLNKLGRNRIGEMLAEVLDNCKQHSKFNEWFALGHCSTNHADRQGKVRLVIFNYGNTIAESFSDSKSEYSMLDKLSNKAKTIRKKFKNCPSIESLLTLYSLQDGISRFHTEGSDRGSGTIKLINLFQIIGKDKNGIAPTMSITSGHTQISFNQNYKMQKEYVNGQVKNIIAFNDSNDIDFPPDPQNVYDLKNSFPGTIISMEFFIDQEYLSNNLRKGAK